MIKRKAVAMDERISDALADMMEASQSIFDAVGWLKEDYDNLVTIKSPTPNTITIEMVDEANLAVCFVCEKVYDKTKGCCQIA